MHYKCPSCGIVTEFDRRHRTFVERLKTWASTNRPHDCSECGREVLIDVHYREPKDVWFALWTVLAGLLTFGALSALIARLGASPH